MFRTCHQLIVWILVFATVVYRSRSSQAAWNPGHCPTACVCRLENSMRKVYCDIQNKQRVLTAIPSNFPADSQLISLGGNQIPTIPVGAFSNLHDLRDLFLNDNGLQSLPRDVFSGLTSLQSLNLANNRLGILPSGLFKDLSTLRDLYLDGNVLENLPNDFFEGLTSLQRLHLHSNKFNAFSERVFGFRGEFRKFTTDKADSVKLGRLLAPEMFGSLSSLSVLTLSHNGIRQVQHGSFDRMSVLEKLKLNDNNITILPQGLFRDLKSLRFLSLYNNPFQCTCALKWLKHWILRNSKSIHVFNSDKITCRGPEKVRGKALITLRDEEFGCKRKQWTEWSTWSTCSGSCGREKQSRTRQCTGHGQLKCKGYAINWRLCETNCKTEWSEWSTWTPCSVSCSVGYQTRNRSTNCTRSPCQRNLESEVRACVSRQCPSHSDWSSWSMCDAVCGQGRQNRTRVCSPWRGGLCSRFETRECKVRECVEWTLWSTWSACNNNCSDGIQTRKRDCIVMAGLKKRCPGNYTEERWCSSGPCPVHGGWSPWQPWSSCSKTCGLGFKLRQRECTSPAPQQGGAACEGLNLKVIKCVESLCEDEFSPWSEWSKCSTQCGKGIQSRSRNCTRLDPVSGFGLCLGNKEEFHECEMDECSGFWGEWSGWNKCFGDCNQGFRLRWRFCINSQGFGVNTCGNNQSLEYQQGHCQATSCSHKPVWSNWSNWSECSKTCGTGSRRRRRFCLTKVIGLQCPGSYESKQACNTHMCPIHGGWSPWSTWSECSRTCGGGIKQRNRTCNNPLPKNNGQQCLGDKSETNKCNTHKKCNDLVIGDEPKEPRQIDLKQFKCPEPKQPNNGKYSVKEQSDGFTYIQYKCNDFFRNDKKSTIRHCMEKGEWSGEPAECVPDCGELGNSVSPHERLSSDRNIMSLNDSWPWQAAIEVDQRGVVCGGSLISDQWIITAAHCILHRESQQLYSRIKVYLGTNNLRLRFSSSGFQEIPVAEVHFHKKFEWKVYDYDIAVLKLKHKANITSWVHPVCLPKSRRWKQLKKEGTTGIMVGWGSLEVRPHYLRQIPLPVVSLSTCQKSHKPYRVTKNMFCAGNKHGRRDTCNRDSGGGFLFMHKNGRKVRWVLGGIVSWGHAPCGELGKYSVFTDVASHIKWINDKIRDKIK